MYNGFYRSISSSAAPNPPPPPELHPERQPQSFATPNYVERSSDPTPRQGVSPPPKPPLPSSVVTDTLNWRHDEGNQLAGDAVNPNEFYRRVPGAVVSEQSYGRTQPAGGLNMRRSTNGTGFYSFAVGSGLNHVQPATQPYSAPAQFAANGYFSTPTPPLPPKPFSYLPQTAPLPPKPTSILAPPIPPKVPESPPLSLHEISRPPTPPNRPPEYIYGGNDNTSYFLPFEKGLSQSDYEKFDEQAILASQESRHVTELRNQQSLLEHMNTLDNAGTSRDHEFAGRWNADDDVERLLAVPSLTTRTSRPNDETSEDELMRRATQLSLIEAETAAARAQQSIGPTDEDGWEVYDPHAFGEESEHDIFTSPPRSFSASPRLPPATPLSSTIQRPMAVLPSPPLSPRLQPALPTTQSDIVQLAEPTGETAPDPGLASAMGPDPEPSEPFLAPPPPYHPTVSRSAPSSPPSRPRPELPNFTSAPEVSPSQGNESPSLSSPDRSTQDHSRSTGSTFSRSRTYQAPNTSNAARPWNANNGSSPPGRDRSLRTSVSHGNLGASARSGGQDSVIPPVPPLSPHSAVGITKLPSRHEAPPRPEPPLVHELSPVSVSSEGDLSQPKLVSEELRTHGRGRSKSQAPPAHRSEWTKDGSAKSPPPHDDKKSPLETPRRPQPTTFLSYLGDLMTGVSFGFGRASLLAKNQAPGSPFPDVISLGPDDAFFIAAPTFRQLLRLLANLGHGIVEELHDRPSQERSRAHLRPAIQLVHVRPPEEPYVILWLELEVPLPEGVHAHGDTSARAFRSVLPPNVQHVPNKGSHLFVCQAPLPPLPRELIDIATYLQSLLVESRRAADTAGLRRLSKLVDRFYPNDGDVNGAMEAPTRRVGGLFSRVMPGRKGAKRSGKGGADVNDESYDLVTPFILDT